MTRRHPQDEATSPDEDADDCSADDDDPKDPSEDSGGGSSESDCSSLDERDSIPLYRPHLSDHGNRPRPNAQQPHAAEESGQKDRGEEQEEPGWREGGREDR